MADFEFKKSASVRGVSVDGRGLDFANGIATRDLAAGEYAVHWFARGDSGTGFSLSVSRPNQQAIKELKGTLGASRKDAGTFWIEIE